VDVRGAILDAASELFAARGVDAVSLRAIARRAGVSPAMVPYYFGDRSGLHAALLERALGRVRAGLAAAVGGASDGPSAVRGLLRTLGGAIAEAPWIPSLMLTEVLADGGHYRERFRSTYAEHVADIVTTVFRREISGGRFRAGLDPRLTLISLLGLAVMPHLARPVLEPLFGLPYDSSEFLRRLEEHTAQIFLEGVLAREETPR
jgi:AcrR family transcriptional regulator